MASHDSLIFTFLFTSIIAVASGLNRGTATQETRLLILERKINLILNHLGIKDDIQKGTVQELILRGQKIQAIKLYREISGVGLKEAKEAVDQMEVSLRAGSQ